MIVSDHSLYDLAYLGSIGAIPGWPGEQTWPPQPMLVQTRAVLDGYAAAGGRYREVAIDDAAHSPHLDQPEALPRRTPRPPVQRLTSESREGEVTSAPGARHTGQHEPGT